jgi:methionyl-tRNA formyltransferase
MNSSRVIFIGTTEFGIPTLEMLKQNYNLELIITQPDKPTGRKHILTPPPVKEWALKNNIKVIQPNKISEATEEIKTVDPDLIIVAAYGQIIPKSILDIPKRGAINLHTSLLPKYRGASPIQSALLDDEKETGVTIMLMDEKMDHGAVLSQHMIKIGDSDNYYSLSSKLSLLAANALLETLPKWLEKKIEPLPQNHEEATFTKILNRNDARIDWTNPARSIIQKIKALNPEPGTWTTLNSKSVKIIEAEETKNGTIDLPGKLYSENGECLVKCGDYSIKLTLVQPEGKKPISGKDFLNGIKNLETKVFV